MTYGEIVGAIVHTILTRPARDVRLPYFVVGLDVTGSRFLVRFAEHVQPSLRHALGAWVREAIPFYLDVEVRSPSELFAPCVGCSGRAPMVVARCPVCGGALIARGDVPYVGEHLVSCPAGALERAAMHTSHARAFLRWR